MLFVHRKFNVKQSFLSLNYKLLVIEQASPLQEMIIMLLPPSVCDVWQLSDWLYNNVLKGETLWNG